jgi:hypothetical protein
MQLSYPQRSDAALSLVDELAQHYGLTIYDPQGDEVTRPQDVSGGDLAKSVGFHVGGSAAVWCAGWCGVRGHRRR